MYPIKCPCPRQYHINKEIRSCQLNDLSLLLATEENVNWQVKSIHSNKGLVAMNVIDSITDGPSSRQSIHRRLSGMIHDLSIEARDHEKGCCEDEVAQEQGYFLKDYDCVSMIAPLADSLRSNLADCLTYIHILEQSLEDIWKHKQRGSMIRAISHGNSLKRGHHQEQEKSSSPSSKKKAKTDYYGVPYESTAAGPLAFKRSPRIKKAAATKATSGSSKSTNVKRTLSYL